MAYNGTKSDIRELTNTHKDVADNNDEGMVVARDPHCANNEIFEMGIGLQIDIALPPEVEKEETISVCEATSCTRLSGREHKYDSKYFTYLQATTNEEEKKTAHEEIGINDKTLVRVIQYNDTTCI